jgi:hypothetical protein
VRSALFLAAGTLLFFRRTCRITEVGKLSAKDDPKRFSIENDVISLGKKLVLLENGRPLYELKHKLGHLYQK